MQESLDLLLEAKETPNDILLVQLVRAQLVVYGFVKELGYEYDPLDQRQQKALLSCYTKGQLARLEAIRAETPPELGQNCKRSSTIHRTACI